MNRRFSALWIVVAVALGGCIFSPDDDAPSHPAPQGWQPEFSLTPDSASIFFPDDWPDTTTFTWNVEPEGVTEYVIEAVVRVTATTEAHLALIRHSDGGATASGTFEALAQGAESYYWSENPTTGTLNSAPLEANEIHFVNGGVLLRVWHPVAEWLYSVSALTAHTPSVRFVQRGHFDFKQVHGRIAFQRDMAQQRARAIDGPLDADDYVVMDVIMRRHAWSGYAIALESRTLFLRNPFGFSPDEGDMFDDYAFNLLQPDHDTRAAFDVVRMRRLDTSALSQAGYQVVDPGTPLAANTFQFAFSGIGYNHARDEAVVYVTFDCGSLCGEGNVYLLSKVDGFWVISDMLMLWIS